MFWSINAAGKRFYLLLISLSVLNIELNILFVFKTKMFIVQNAKITFIYMLLYAFTSEAVKVYFIQSTWGNIQ